MRRRQPAVAASADAVTGMPAALQEWVPEDWVQPSADPDRTVFAQMWDSRRRWESARDEWAQAHGVDPRTIRSTLRMVQAVTEASLARGGRSFQGEMSRR